MVLILRRRGRGGSGQRVGGSGQGRVVQVSFWWFFQKDGQKWHFWENLAKKLHLFATRSLEKQPTNKLYNKYSIYIIIIITKLVTKINVKQKKDELEQQTFFECSLNFLAWSPCLCHLACLSSFCLSWCQYWCFTERMRNHSWKRIAFSTNLD